LQEVVSTGVILALFGWLVVLLVAGVWLSYGVQSVALPALVNAIFTGVLVVYVNNVIQVPALAALIGLLIGVLVGTALCWLCDRIAIRTRGLRNE